MEVRIFIKERQPKSSAEAAKLADDYWQARKTTFGKRTGFNKAPLGGEKKCQTCGKLGHLATDCRRNSSRPQETSEVKPLGNRPERGKKDLKDIECFNCHKKGHYSSNCPAREKPATGMFCMERRMDHQGQSVLTKSKVRGNPCVPKTGAVEGKEVERILLDTGCSRTLIRKDLVPQHKLLHGEAVAIRCAHGDTVLYPLAEVDLEVEGYPIHVEAAISDTLPMPVLLGTDVPELTALLTGNLEDKSSPIQPKGEALAVMTRAKAKKQKEEAAVQTQKERESGAQPTTLLDDSDQIEHQVQTESTDPNMDYSNEPQTQVNGEENNEDNPQGSQTRISIEEDYMDDLLLTLDDELFVPSHNKQTLTRREKREQRVQYQQKQKDSQTQLHPLDISMTEFRELQQKDPTLQQCREAAEGHPSTAGIGFYQRSGLLYRRWMPPRQGTDGVEVEQLVLPKECREGVLKLAHNIPLAGHMGKEKTARRTLQRFYWPTLYGDVEKFCKGCLVCQKSSKRRVQRAPLIPLPIIQEPFKRIAMDIVGPIPRSSSGKRYILVVCDYATRYPEAIPLKSIDAPHIAEQLVTPFSRVGIPDEILTDQGSNCTSQLLTRSIGWYMFIPSEPHHITHKQMV